MSWDETSERLRLSIPDDDDDAWMSPARFVERDSRLYRPTHIATDLPLEFLCREERTTAGARSKLRETLVNALRRAEEVFLHPRRRDAPRRWRRHREADARHRSQQRLRHRDPPRHVWRRRTLLRWRYEPHYPSARPPAAPSGQRRPAAAYHPATGTGSAPPCISVEDAQGQQGLPTCRRYLAPQAAAACVAAANSTVAASAAAS